MLVHRMVVLPIHNIGDALDVAAEARKPEGIKVALSTGGIDGIVDGVVCDGGSDGAGDDSVQRARTGDAAELHLSEQQLGGVVECGDVGAREPILQANASEGKLADRIAGEEREAGAVLIVILNEFRVDADGLAGEERGLAGLVKLVAAGKNREPGGDGAVKEIRLGKSEKKTARKIVELRRKGKSLAKTQKVVGLIGEADEAAGQTADAALQADGLLALLLELEVDVDGAFFIVALNLGGLVRFDLVEVIELIEAQDSKFPETLVEELALGNHKLAANDFVARSGVAAKVDAANKILLLFVEAQGQVNDLGGIVDFSIGLGGEIDESIFAVDFAVSLEGLADLFRGEDVALLEGESALQGIDLQRQGLVWIRADDFEGAHAIALALFDGDGDVDGLAVAFSGDKGNSQARMRSVNVIENRFANGDLEVAVVAIQAANADFQVLAQLFAVVGFGENGDIPEVKRNRVGAVVAHGANQLTVAESVVALEFNLSDFDLGAFLDFENENDGVAGSDALVLRSDFSELPAMLGQQLLQHDFRFLDLGGIKLAFNTETDFAFLEAIENVGFGNGVVAVVTDASDLRAFFDLEDDNFAVRAIGRVFHTKLYVLKELRVPKGLKIAAQRLFIVDIAGPAEDSRRQGVAAHAAVANEIDTLDHKLLLRGGLRVPRRMIFDNVFAVCVVKGSKIGRASC